MAGMDPMRFFETTEQDDIVIMQAIAEEYMNIIEQMQDSLAVKIANAVWGAVK